MEPDLLGKALSLWLKERTNLTTPKKSLKLDAEKFGRHDIDVLGIVRKLRS